MPFRFIPVQASARNYEEFSMEKAQEAFDQFESSYACRCSRPSKSLKKAESFLKSHEMHLSLMMDVKVIGQLPALDDYINENYQLQLGDSKMLSQINFSRHESMQVPMEKLAKSRISKKTALPVRLQAEHIYSAQEQILINSAKPLAQILADLMQEKQMDLADLVFKSNLDRSVIVSILQQKTPPDKIQLCALALAFELNLHETGALLAKGGFAFSDSDLADLIFLFFAEQEVYDIFTMNLALYKYGQALMYA